MSGIEAGLVQFNFFTILVCLYGTLQAVLNVNLQVGKNYCTVEEPVLPGSDDPPSYPESPSHSLEGYVFITVKQGVLYFFIIPPLLCDISFLPYF